MKSFAHPPVDEITLPNVLYVLGDGTRLAIVKNLLDADRPLTCSEAVEGIDGLPVSTRSHCFTQLRQAGIIRSEKKGRECFSHVRLDDLEGRFPGLLPHIIKQLDD